MYYQTIEWLKRERASSRLALVLQLGSRVCSSAMALVWSRLLIGAMGSSLYGCFANFLNLASLGGLGDLGMGGAVNYRLAQFLGQGKEGEAARFLAPARGLFVLLGITAGGAFFLLSPVLSRWFDFAAVPGLGSAPALFAMGAAAVVIGILASYSANVNYACGNLVWPVVPGLVLAQLGLFSHWLLARQGFPLWLQYSPYVAVAFGGLLLARTWVRQSHPQLAAWLPIQLDWRAGLVLFESSLWVYLCGLGNKIFVSTDGLLVQRGFGAAQVPMYQLNYKACELALFVVTTSAFVAMPKIARWLASSASPDRERALAESLKLNQFQSFFGCAAALAYLAGNGLFMRLWWYHAAHEVPAGPVLLQTAFALNLAVTACGDAAIQITGRTGPTGLRFMGITIGATGLLNFGLSIIAMHFKFMAGIAFATVLSQALLSLITTGYVCRHFGNSPWKWSTRTVIAPLALIGLAGWLRLALPLDSARAVGLLIASYLGILCLLAGVIGITPATLKAEWALVRAMLKSKSVAGE